MALPIGAYVIFGLCVALMGFSAFYLGDKSAGTRGFARVGIVLGGTGLFLSALYYFSIMLAVLIVLMPVFLIVAWFQDIF